MSGKACWYWRSRSKRRDYLSERLGIRGIKRAENEFCPVQKATNPAGTGLI